MAIQIEMLTVGPIQTNTYVLHGDGACGLVDPGMWPRPVLKYLRRGNLSPEVILLTHGHGDHIAGAGKVKEAYPHVELLCPAGDQEMLTDARTNLSAQFGLAVTAPPADRLIRPGLTLTLGATEWQVLDTAGHTPGGVSFYCQAQKVVFTGDALFAGSIGRTDIPGADPDLLLTNIRRCLYALPDDTLVLPGHGPSTTIGGEKQANPFVRA